MRGESFLGFLCFLPEIGSTGVRFRFIRLVCFVGSCLFIWVVSCVAAKFLFKDLTGRSRFGVFGDCLLGAMRGLVTAVRKEGIFLDSHRTLNPVGKCPNVTVV